MFDKSVWKYFLYFLFIGLIVFFLYAIYKMSKTNPIEGFQSNDAYFNGLIDALYEKLRGTFPYPYEIRVGELSAWNLSLPPEFETIRTSWSNGVCPHLYVGTLNSVQQSTITGFERYFNNWSLAFSKDIYPSTIRYDTGWGYQRSASRTMTFGFDTAYSTITTRIRLSGNQRSLELAQGSPITTWMTITPVDLRRLNPILADIIVSYAYSLQMDTIKEIEYVAWRNGWIKAKWLYNNWNSDGRKGVADHIKANMSAALRNNKTNNDYITTFVTLDSVNSEAAQRYLASEPNALNYLNQVGAFLQWTAIGELAGPVMDGVGTALRAVRGANYGRGFLRVNTRTLVGNVRKRATQLIVAHAKRLKHVNKLIKSGKVLTGIARQLGTAARGIKTALFANPVGIVMGLADAILSLIPDSVWRSWGEAQAENQINDLLLRCPIGYIDGNRLDLGEFSTYLDLLPIPSGFGEMEKAKARKLTCVAFDDTGQTDTQPKRQCTWPGAAPSYNGDDQKRIPAWSTDLGKGRLEGDRAAFKNLDTCFGDPDPPMEIFPIEPIPPVLDTVDNALKNIAATADGATLTYFNEIGLLNFFTNTPTWTFLTSANATTSVTTASNEIYARIRQEAFITPLQAYNSNITESNASNAINMLNVNNIPAGIEQNYDFYYGTDTGSTAISNFLRASLADRLENSTYAPKFTYLSTLTGELSNILSFDIAEIKSVVSSPMIFSPLDTTVYRSTVMETAVHTLALLPYREKMATYITGKVADALRYDQLLTEYNTALSIISTEMGRFFDINAAFLDRCAQYIYDETHRISNGLTVTLIDKIVGAVVTCNNLITLICNVSCINRGKGAAVWRQPTPNSSGGAFFSNIFPYPRPTSADDNVPIEIYVDNNGNITAWGRPVPNATTPSMIYRYVMRRVELNYTPTISYRHTSYFRTACSTVTTMQTQVNYYKENNPNKNIKAITGWKVVNVSTCAVRWTETDYNPSENTEGPVMTRTANFFYETPNTPYPFNTNNTPIFDIYQGYAMTSNDTLGYTSSNISQPNRGLPAEATLLGGCGRRCYDAPIMSSIMARFNTDTTISGTSRIVNIKKIFTAKDNRCDFVANVNTGRGTIVEQRRQAIITLLSSPACTYRVASIGPVDSGTFVSFTEGFQSGSAVDYNVTPYPGYMLQSTTVNSPTVPRYNFGENILGSVVGSIQNLWTNLTDSGQAARLRTYATAGFSSNLEGCTGVQCMNDEIIRAMATKYNIDNWGKTRMNRVLKVNTAGPLECDVQFEDLNVSGSNRFVNFWRDPFSGRYASDRREITRLDNVTTLSNTFKPAGSSWVNMSTVIFTMRFNLRKIPNTCEFEATSYRMIQPDLTTAEIEDLSKPLLTTNAQTRTLAPIPNVSSMLGCAVVDILNDHNTNVMMCQLYQQQNPNNILRSINRIYRFPTDTNRCTVEFGLSNRIGEYQPNAGVNSNAWVRDTYIFTFAADSNPCRWRIQSAAAHPTDGLQFTKGSNFGSRGTNYVPGMAVSLIGLASDTYNFTLPKNYIPPSCPASLVLNPQSLATQNSARAYYTLFSGHQITRIVESAFINSNKCEYKVETTAGTSFEATHLHFRFIPFSDCTAHQAIGFSNVPIANSVISGWARPDNPACLPINCSSVTIQALARSAINPWNLAQSNATFNRIARVNSNTCEFEITTQGIVPQTTYNSNAYRRVAFRAVGPNCETQVTGTSIVANQSDSLTFAMPFSCPSFNPMNLFTGNNAFIHFSILQQNIRELYLTSQVFIDSATAASSWDIVNGPSIRSDSNGVIIDRARILPTNAPSGNLRAEFEIRLRAYLSRPNSVTYPYTLALAKKGTLISQATNQVDWTNYNNQFPVTPGSTWGPRQPPSEFRPEGVYEFAQSNFTTWQPALHPVIEFNFPTLNCESPSIRNATTFRVLGITYVATREQSIFT